MNQDQKIFAANSNDASTAKYEITLSDVGFGCCFMPKHSHDVLVRIGVSDGYDPIANAIVSVNPFHQVTAFPAITVHSQKLCELWEEVDAIGQGGCLSKPFMIFEAGKPTIEVQEWMSGVFGERPSTSQTVESFTIMF